MTKKNNLNNLKFLVFLIMFSLVGLVFLVSAAVQDISAVTSNPTLRNNLSTDNLFEDVSQKYQYPWERDSEGFVRGTWNITPVDESDSPYKTIFEVPFGLFDISFNLEDSIIQRKSELSGIVTFQNFGDVPTSVDLTFTILDESGNEIYREKSKITIMTEEVLRWNYNSLEGLPKGGYTAVLTTLYYIDISDMFRVGFEVTSIGKVISLWMGVIGGFIAVLIIVIKGREYYKSKTAPPENENENN